MSKPKCRLGYLLMLGRFGARSSTSVNVVNLSMPVVTAEKRISRNDVGRHCILR